MGSEMCIRDRVGSARHRPRDFRVGVSLRGELFVGLDVGESLEKSADGEQLIPSRRRYYLLLRCILYMIKLLPTRYLQGTRANRRYR